MIWIPNQLVGAPIGSNVTLECHTDSSPKAIAYWIFNNNMVLNSFTHRAEDQFHSMYKLDSRLHIKNLQAKDFGSYKCVSKNSLGETEDKNVSYDNLTEIQENLKIELENKKKELTDIINFGICSKMDR